MNLPIPPQLPDRAAPQRGEELARIYEAMSRLREVGPELGASTLDAPGDTLARPTGGHMVLSLLGGYSRPFRCKHLALRLGASAGTVDYAVALYRVERRAFRTGDMEWLLSASAAGNTNDTGSARKLVELSREVLINTEDLWFAGVWIDTNGLVELLSADDDNRFPCWTAYLASTAVPSVLSWQTGDTAMAAAGDVTRHHEVPAIQAISLTGKRLLWD